MHLNKALHTVNKSLTIHYTYLRPVNTTLTSINSIYPPIYNTLRSIMSHLSDNSTLLTVLYSILIYVDSALRSDDIALMSLKRSYTLPRRLLSCNALSRSASVYECLPLGFSGQRIPSLHQRVYVLLVIFSLSSTSCRVNRGCNLSVSVSAWSLYSRCFFSISFISERS